MKYFAGQISEQVLTFYSVCSSIKKLFRFKVAMGRIRHPHPPTSLQHLPSTPGLNSVKLRLMSLKSTVKKIGNWTKGKTITSENFVHCF